MSNRNTNISKLKGKREISKKQPGLPVAVLLVIAFSVIVIAFVIEAIADDEDALPPEDDYVGEVYISRSEVQARLSELDWVEQMFLDINPFSRPGFELEEVTGVVIHNIGNPNTTAVQNRNFFNNLQHTQDRHASSHFIVCLDGSIVQCVPVDEIAYASNFRNYDSISIEVTHPDATGKFTDETYAAVVKLTAWLCIQYGLSAADDVIRHADVHGIVTDCPRYFVNNPEAWERFLLDVEHEMGRISQ